MIDLEHERQHLHHIWSIGVVTHFLERLALFIKKSKQINQGNIPSDADAQHKRTLIGIVANHHPNVV